MSDYDPLATLAAQPQSPQTPGYDPLSMVAAGKVLPNAPAAVQPKSAIPDWMSHGNPVDQFVQGAADQAITSAAGAIGGGLKGLWDIATGNKSAAPQDVENIEQESAYKPQTPVQAAGASIASSNWKNPLNWPGVALSKAGQLLGNTAERLGASPAVSTALDVAPAAVASIAGIRGIDIKAREPYVLEAESGPKVVPPSTTPDGPPVEGGLPKDAQATRQAILKRVGVGQARQSAVEGDAKAADTDFQATKFDEPVGREASAQFEHERSALSGFLQGLIKKVGGSIGLDEDSLNARGQAIAKPFDALRDWFGQKQRQLYGEAQSRSDQLAAHGNPGALTQLPSVDALLKSPDFQNTLLAKDQGSLLTGVQRQLEQFRRNNPNGFTPAAAEQVRQWLNQVWSPNNSRAIGQLKGAIDDDVTSAAGEDLYTQARAVTALKAKTLENPNGISSLFDTDPNTPLNRSTPFEKIPDKIMALPVEQFANLFQTLKDMPPELQDEAQSAIGEIKGQLLNRMLKAGTETRSGRQAQVWHGEDVSQVLARHAAKFRIAFADDPVTQAAIKDANSAGQILRVDQSYPGAYAQAANLVKRGVGSAIVRQVGRAGGAAAGAALGNPITAVGGEMAGSALGERAGAALDERAALKNWRKRVVSLEP